MGSILICMIQSCSPWLGDRKGEPHPQPNSIGDLILYILNSKLCFKAVHNFHVHSSTLQERSRQLTGVHPPFLSLTSYSEMSAELFCGRCGARVTLSISSPPRLPHRPFLQVLYNYQGATLAAEKAMAPHSSTLAWKIPWTEDPGGPQSMGLLRVRHD